jgi:glycosyltransferase involved in cell wall biosynthesis
LSKPDLIAVVWAPHERRTDMFAQQLHARVYFVHYLSFKRPWIAPFKYVLQFFKTMQILFTERPRYIYVTNPPFFAAMCAWLYGLVSGSKYIMDTHPPALYGRKWAWSVPIQRFFAKQAFLNITDQDRWVRLFESWGARGLTLENPPKNPPAPEAGMTPKVGEFHVLVVNTFAEDEPVQPVLDAAAALPDVHFHITGDLAKAAPYLEKKPANVEFTGYLKGMGYWGHLYRANAIMVLTTFPYSLLGGAQEGVLIDKPLILSRQPVLEEYFTKGTVFVENTAESLMDGVKQARQNESTLIAEIGVLREEQATRWEANFQKLTDLIKQG